MNGSFDYTYDSTGLFVQPGYIAPDDLLTLQEELNVLGWKPAAFLTNRADDLHTRSQVMFDLACRLFADPMINQAVTYPHRLLESYALNRMHGGSLPLHGGSLEPLSRFGAPHATDISCAYIFRDARMYSMRVKALLYLDDVPGTEDGPLVYVEGSHKANYPFFPTFRQDEELSGHDYLVRRVPVSAGTCVVLNEALIHGALPKESTHDRRLLVFTFGPSFITDWKEVRKGTTDIGRIGFVVPDTEDSF